MLFAGIAWSADGYEIAFADQAGRPETPARRFGGGELPDLVTFLTRVDRPLAIVVESTNGAVDGFLLAAGLTVYRADPPALADSRPDFGSIAASSLARLAAKGLSSLSELVAEEGSLTGRHLPPSAAFAPVGTELEARGRALGCVKHGPRDSLAVALSFDDGPHPVYTNQILEVLARYDARATFFPIGLSTSGLGHLLAKAAAAGHDVGNHTWSHPYLPDLSAAGLREQIERTSDAISNATGARPSLVRPPYGSLTADVVDKWTGFEERIALWDVDSADWARPGADAIVSKVLGEIQPGSIVLMHDSGGDRSQTVEALPSIIEGCLERGYNLATVPELVPRLHSE
ncbi:MAG TPA: polysaccharide deacetylase family protein [Actinocrinis sp.]|nr:polysaccharide deacetylase family protein [Actinocrinis sp.]